MPTLTQAVTDFEAQLSEVVKTFTTVSAGQRDDAFKLAEINMLAVAERAQAAALSVVQAINEANDAQDAQIAAAASQSSVQIVATAFGTVQAAIDGATAQAVISTTSAGTATTQAGLAATAKTAAETARDVSLANMANLAASSGSEMLGYLHTIGVDQTTLQNAIRAEFCNVNLYFKAGEADATAMFNRATAAARRVYVPSGNYYLSSANWPSNTAFEGDGDTSILRMTAAAADLFTNNSGSSDVANNIVNLRMRNMQLLATSDVDGFFEQKHLIRMSGVSQVLFEQVLFKGFRGDGVYFGSGAGGQERHNENVTIRRCVFDGINRENRNAISCVDIDTILIEGCTFKNCSKSNMPGPIDFEPNPSVWHIIKNVTVRRNRFLNNGGNVGEVSVFVPAVVASVPQNITVENNTSTGYLGISSSGFFFFKSARIPTATSQGNNLKLRFNSVTNGVGTACRPFALYDGKDIVIEGNRWTDVPLNASIGYTGVTDALRNVRISGDVFTRCGSVDGAGMTAFTVDYLDILNTSFIDCGRGTAGDKAINFNAGTSSYVNFDGLLVSSPTGKTFVAIQKEAAHTFTTSTNKFNRSNVGGLANSFVAEDSDTLEQSYLPVITGSSSAGLGTYTTQYGVFKRTGKTVFFRIKLVVAAGHTGTGMIQVALPLGAAAASGNAERAMALMVDGAATTGGQIALLNPAVTVGGVLGALRCYFSGTGVMGQMIMPVGAFSVYASGSYQAA